MPHRLLSIALASAGLAGLFWSLRLSWACRASGRQDYATAARWWPRNAGFARDLAAVEPEREKAHLERALALAPQAAPVMVSLGLIAESAGDAAGAKNWFERALAADRRYRTAWAYLNFLFRHQEGAAAGGFREAAGRAFSMSHRNRQALLELCWSQTADGHKLLDLAGERPPVLWDVARFLMDQNQVAAAASAYEKLLAAPYLTASYTNGGRVATRQERLALGLDLVDLALHRRERDLAWRTWRSVSGAGLLPVADGGSAAAQWGDVQRGFDWHKADEGVERDADGWTLRWTDRPAGEKLLLWRYVPPHMSAEFQLEVSGDPGGAIQWRSVDGRIEIFYHRPPGQVAPPGEVTLRNPRWEGRP